MSRLIRITTPVVLAALAFLALHRWASRAAPLATPVTINTGQHFLPPYPNPRDRFGFDCGSLSGYDVAQLHAGWYSNWTASLNPAHPDGLVYVQLIRFKAGSDPHDPAQVTVSPSKATIAAIAAAHPGSLWLMSNEPDSLYQGNPIYPDVYAVVYHDFYQYIKGLDPSALIANGGIVQPTPCRLEYLDIVLNTYQTTYGEPMPVDVWNIHAFILREVYGSWGASTPPGVDPSCGIDYAIDDADDMAIFEANIRAMRAWLKEKGYQDRPLIVSEYGILWPQWYAPQFTPARVSHFMTQTFDLFLHTTDTDIGYPADGYRLVQAWAWYSLSDDQQYNGYLFNSSDKTLSPMGAAYRDYTAALSDTLYADLSAMLNGAWPSFTPPLTDTSAGLTLTVSLTGGIGNLGKLPVTNTLARLEVLQAESGTPLFQHESRYDVPARFAGVVMLPPLSVTLPLPGLHAMRLMVDPEGEAAEGREGNNVTTTTLDVRPDLVASGIGQRLWTPPPGSVWLGNVLTLTIGVDNGGNWPSTPVSATVAMSTWPGTLALPTHMIKVSPLSAGAHATTTAVITALPLGYDFYQVQVSLDSTGHLEEQSEANNRATTLVPVGVEATLAPTGTAVLTSAGGQVRLFLAAGAVTTPTVVRYLPLWPGDWDTGPLAESSLAFSLGAHLDGQPIPLTFNHPVTVVWAYEETDVAGLDEAALRLFVEEAGGWRDAGCWPYQRSPGLNQFKAFLCRTGRFLVGVRYDLYLPAITSGGSTAAAHAPAGDGWPPGPLRLP